MPMILGAGGIDVRSFLVLNKRLKIPPIPIDLGMFMLMVRTLT
jgi:hypothetical protein